MKEKIGAKRLVVGAHHGFKDWLLQRVTACIMTVYTIILLVLFFMAQDFSYMGWAGLFKPMWFKLLTILVWLSLCYHAWIGIRDIWMDYIKPVSIRITLHTLTVLWLIACAFYAVMIIWRI